MKQKTEHFWSGFAAGTIFSAILLYVFSTEKGRNKLSELLEHSDSFEHNVEKLLDYFKEQGSENK